jgi:GNAT superfamily N-acetyltransferase
MIYSLTPETFDDSLRAIFEHIASENGVAERLDWEYFRTNWGRMIYNGIAHAWTNDEKDTVLGAAVYNDIFNGDKVAAVCFWFSLPGARGTGRPQLLFDAFEAFCESNGIRNKKAASFMNLSAGATRKSYEKRGYKKTEEIWSL